MNYILDTNAIYYCSGASTHKNYSSPMLKEMVKKGRTLFVSLWSFLELATHFEFSKDQILRVLKYINKNQFGIVPFYVEQGCSTNIINSFLLQYGYVLISKEISYIDGKGKQKTINGYLLNKVNKKVRCNNIFIKIAKEKSRIEAFFLRFFFTSVYYNLLKLFEIDLQNQQTKDSFNNSCVKDVKEKIYSMANDYERELEKCYLGKTLRERRTSIKEIKSIFFDDINFYIFDIANLYEIYNSNGVYKYISAYFKCVKEGNDYTNPTKNSARKILFKDFISENDFSIHIDKVSDTLINLEPDPINQECLKSYYLYIKSINIKLFYQNSKIEKNDMFDVQYFSYYPDFFVFTCDNKMADNIKRINTTLYTELIPYL